MKKFLLIAVAAFGMLMTACSKDEVAQPVAEKSVVTFTVEAPVMATRAHGDGLTATDLTVLVYQRGGALLFEKEAEMVGLKATVELPFVNGMEYDLVFWAEAENSPYKLDKANKSVTYTDPTALVSNSESYDAFYAYVNDIPEIKGPVTKTVELKRPFAQLNIATNDTEDADDSGLVVENVAVEVTNAYTQFSLVSGNGVDNTNTGVTFTSAPKQGGKILTDYDLLAVNYLFTGGEKQLVNVKFTYTDRDTKGGNAGRTVEYNSVPVQRNYRTNIVGSLLTSDGKFNIEIKPGFDGEQGVVDGNNYIKVATAEELDAALNDLTVDEIILEEDVVLSETLIIGGTTRAETEAVVRNLTIDGNGKTLKSTAARAINVLGVDGVTIKNLTINCSGERAINIIQNATNVTIENVTATAANYTVNVAASAPNAVVDIKGSTLNGLCTVNVASAGAKVTVDDCTVNCNDNNTTAGEAYAALNLNKDAVKGVITVTNSEINVPEDSDSEIARNGAEDGIITINGSTEGVHVKVAAITFEDSDYYYSFETLEAAVEFAKEGDTVTLIRNIEQEDGVLITDKNITIDLNNKSFTVSEGASTNNRNFKINGESVVTIKNGTLVADGELTSGAYGTIRTEDTAIVTLNDVKLYSCRGFGLNVKAYAGTKVTINDSEIHSQYSGGVEAAGGEIVLNDVTIDQNGVYSSGAWCSVAIGVNGGGKVVVNSGTYSAKTIAEDANAAQGTWVAYVMSSGGTLEINGGTFTGGDSATANAANACGIICADRAAVVNIYGGTFNAQRAILDMRNNVGTQPNPIATLYGGDFSHNPIVSGLYSSNLIKVAEGKVAVQHNGRWTLKEGVTTTEALEETGGVLKSGTVLALNGAEYNGTITAEGDLTIIGDTKIKTLKAVNGGTITIEDGKTLTLNNFSFGSKDTAGEEYEIKGGTVVANYGFFQHGKYTLRSNFKTGYMYYSYGSDITVYGTFHSEGKGDGLDYVRGKLTIAKGGKSIHDKSLWIGQPASWGAMEASMTIEDGGYVQVNSLSVYEGSSLTYSNDADLKYNTVSGAEYIIKK